MCIPSHTPHGPCCSTPCCSFGQSRGLPRAVQIPPPWLQPPDFTPCQSLSTIISFFKLPVIVAPHVPLSGRQIDANQAAMDSPITPSLKRRHDKPGPSASPPRKVGRRVQGAQLTPAGPTPGPRPSVDDPAQTALMSELDCHHMGFGKHTDQTRGRGLGRRDLGYGSQGLAPQAKKSCRTPNPSVPTLSLWTRPTFECTRTSAVTASGRCRKTTRQRGEIPLSCPYPLAVWHALIV